MSGIAVAIVVFVCTFAAAVAGIACRARLPDHPVSEAKEVVGIGMGLVATMTALILGLVVASAKSAFDARDSAVRILAVDILTLDRTLAQYGPEAALWSFGLFVAVRDPGCGGGVPGARDGEPVRRRDERLERTPARGARALGSVAARG